ncbi:MAG: LCP family protein [Armatimonadetes bacterium]|nr:LCP family protein [Armatimonadota bacterium]
MPGYPPTPPVDRRRPRTLSQRRLRFALWTIFGVGVSFVVGMFVAVRHEPGNKVVAVAKGLVRAMVSPEYVFDGRERLNVLLIGEDVSLTNQRQQIKSWSRADTNILISLDRLSHGASAVSLPRDTRVIVPGSGVHKLNAAHRFGGPALLMDTIRQNFGLDIHHYLKTNFHGFVEIVDLLGGVDVDVERDMNYDDTWQDFHVHLKTGVQHLTGAQAHGYVRWRKNNPRSKGGDGTSDPLGDLGRTERQQKVMRIIVQKALSPQYIRQLPAIAAAVRRYITTDLNDSQLLSLVEFVHDLPPGALQTITLPCDYRRPYMVVLEKEATAKLSLLFGATFHPDVFASAASTASAWHRAEAAHPSHRVPAHEADEDDPEAEHDEEAGPPPDAHEPGPHEPADEPAPPTADEPPAPEPEPSPDAAPPPPKGKLGPGLPIPAPDNKPAPKPAPPPDGVPAPAPDGPR